MRLSLYNLKKPKVWVMGGLAILSLTCINYPSQAFVPYIYEPSTKDLKSTSINLGKTAAQLLHFGQIKEASRLAKLSVKLNPQDERLWAILAETQVRTNLLQEATHSLAKAKEINPKNPKLWFAEGSLYLQLKNPKQATYLIEKGLQIDPKNAHAYFQLGNAQIMQSKLRLALKAFKNASNLKPKFWEAINNQGLVLFEMGKIKEAIIIWRNVLTIEKNPEPMLALAAALNQLKQTNNESRDLAKEALAENPNYVSTQHQADQLWGYKLQEATKKLFNDPELKFDVERALANSN